MSINNPASWEAWYDTSEKLISHERITAARDLHLPFLNTILSYNKYFAYEIGIGTGTLGYSLKKLANERDYPINIIETDFSQTLLRNAMHFNGNQGINYSTCDAFALPFSNVLYNNSICFHQGFLEHFSDIEILRLLCEQLRISDTVVATVPSHLYSFKEGLRGDERLMPIEKWMDIVTPRFKANGFYYGLNPGESNHICLTINN